MNAIPQNRTRRVRHMLGKPYLKREMGSRNLVNDYNRTQDDFNNIMLPKYSNNVNTVKKSSRFLRTLRKPYNSYMINKNMDFLTKPVARRTRRTHATRRNLR